jgi:hypothetical protein
MANAADERCHGDTTVKNVHDSGKNRLAVVCQQCGSAVEYL